MAKSSKKPAPQKPKRKKPAPQKPKRKKPALVLSFDLERMTPENRERFEDLHRKTTESRERERAAKPKATAEQQARTLERIAWLRAEHESEIQRLEADADLLSTFETVEARVRERVLAREAADASGYLVFELDFGYQVQLGAEKLGGKRDPEGAAKRHLERIVGVLELEVPEGARAELEKLIADAIRVNEGGRGRRPTVSRQEAVQSVRKRFHKLFPALGFLRGGTPRGATRRKAR
jgi:hypothetical protein